MLRHLKKAVTQGAQGPAPRIYAAAVRAARNQELYTRFDVPDTVDGRFDMLALYLFLLQYRMRDEPGGAEVMQDVMDRFVADMDQNLREIGIGDPSMGRAVRSMVEALHGRFMAYADGLAAEAGSGILAAALARNVYRNDGLTGPAVDGLAGYVRAEAERLAALTREEIFDGRLVPQDGQAGGSDG